MQTKRKGEPELKTTGAYPKPSLFQVYFARQTTHSFIGERKAGA